MRCETLQSPACEVRWFHSPEELVWTAARDWIEWFQVLRVGGRDPAVALSGGRIAKAFLEAANKALASHSGLIAKTQFFWADERCVPPEHPESNFGMAWKHLLRPSGVPESNLHRIHGEIEPMLAATTAARDLARWTGAAAGTVPRLDLVLLGMGEDGHVASLFPGEPPELMSSKESYRSVAAPKPPPDRVTLGYSVLSQADQVWVLASGSGKEQALRTSLESPERTPLGWVLGSRSQTRIYTDLSPAKGFRG